MNEKIQDHFSCADWIIIPASTRNEIAAAGLTFIAQSDRWANNPIINTTHQEHGGVEDYEDARLRDIEKTLITSSINGYYIMEGKGLQYIYQSLCERLSRNSYVYYLSIDLWAYYSAYAYYENGEEKRFYCANVDDNGEFCEEDRGSVLPCEKNAELKIPTTDIEGEQAPNCWYLPLGIMYNVGLTDVEISQAFSEPCAIYSFDSNDVRKMKEVFFGRN